MPGAVESRVGSWKEREMKQRMVVYVLLVVGLLFASYTVWNWYDFAAALEWTGDWFPRMAFLGPFVAVVAAGLLVMERVAPGSLDQDFSRREPKARKILFGAIALGL